MYSNNLIYNFEKSLFYSVVHPKMEVLLLFTNLHVVQRLSNWKKMQKHHKSGAHDLCTIPSLLKLYTSFALKEEQT